MQKLTSNLHLTKKQLMGLAVIVVFLGLLLLSFNYINKKMSTVYDAMNVKLMENEIPEISYKEESDPNSSPDVEEAPPVVGETPTEEQAPSTSASQQYYIGTLEIPKIGFKRGFTSKDSPLNTVNKNITVLGASDLPDKVHGNFIIAGHSGNSSVAFFANLYKLAEGDTAIVTYNNKKYTYQIKSIYLQPKVGKVAIYRDKNKTTLTLITCTKDDDKNQTIYIAEIIKEENI